MESVVYNDHWNEKEKALGWGNSWETKAATTKNITVNIWNNLLQFCLYTAHCSHSLCQQPK